MGEEQDRYRPLPTMLQKDMLTFALDGHKVPAEYLHDEKELYVTITCEFQQWPSTEASHNRGTGVHWMKVKRALRPRKRFTVTRTNHTNHRFQLWVKRSSVIAKELLLQAAATMEQTPVILFTYR
jgi:hypothetical protein